MFWSCGKPDLTAPIPRRSLGSYEVGTEVFTYNFIWSPPSTDGGCPVQCFKLYKQTAGADEEIFDGENVDNVKDPTILNYDGYTNGITAGQTYNFRIGVETTKETYYTAYTPIKAAGRPEPFTSPSTMFSQNVALSTVNSIRLDWPVVNDNGGTVMGYKVYRNNGMGTDISTSFDTTCQMEENPVPLGCAITGLTPGETYDIQIKGVRIF